MEVRRPQPIEFKVIGFGSAIASIMANVTRGMLQDLRYAVRTLRNAPGFTLVAVLSLALGIGANTALFSLIDRLLLATLPVHEPERLHQLTVTHRTGTGNNFSYPDYLNLRDGFDFFEGVFVWASRQFEVTWEDRTELANTTVISGEYFELLGVRPAIGRLIRPEDDSPGGEAAVLGYRFWQRSFNADPEVVGKPIRAWDGLFTIVGVASPNFSGTEVGEPPDLYVPAHSMPRVFEGFALERSGSYWLQAMARLKPGYSASQVGPILLARWPEVNNKSGVLAVDGWQQQLHIEEGGGAYSEVRLEFSYALLLLSAVVAFVLLIACANIANLMLIRASRQAAELSVRVAVGASAWRLARQSLVEGLLTSAAGGLGGILVAGWFSQILLLFLPESDRSYLDFGLNPTILAFTAATTMATAIVCSVLPALRASNASPQVALRGASRGLLGDRSPLLSRWVVALQISVCLVMVVGAGLFTRSLTELDGADLGFSRQELLLVRADPPGGNVPAEHAKFQRDTLEPIRNLPGVRNAALAAMTPFDGGAWWDPVVVHGRVSALGEHTTVYLNGVTPGYFDTARIPLVAGRDFTEHDRFDPPHRVVIVNEAFVRRFLPNRDPLGARLDVSRDRRLQDVEIVGVVGDTKYRDIREEPRELVWAPIDSSWVGTIVVGVDAGVPITTVVPSIRQAIAEMDANVPVSITRFDDLVDRHLQRDRMIARLSAGFGALGLLLASIGLYGVVSYSLSRRTREIGIRLALGASPTVVRAMVITDTLKLALFGCAVGIPAAVAASQAIGEQLFLVSPSDPVTLAFSVALLAGVACIAGFIPAWRASALNPTAALRSD